MDHRRQKEQKSKNNVVRTGNIMHEQADSMMFNIQIHSDEAELTEDP